MNKGELRVHFKDLLNRSDITDTLANTFIDQAISRTERTLRVPSMEKQHVYNISASTSLLVIPSDFLEIINIYSGATSLTRVPINELLEFSSGGENGTPKYFTREDETLLIYPNPTFGSVKLNYYAQFAEMTSDTDENALAISSSDLIIYGALGYASDHFLDERGPLFEQKYQMFMREIQEQANTAEQSGTVQAIRPTYAYED